ncbi:MAG: apolipoprotein N-acyltransferase [Candidatus Eremiobacteraeota bacterium]|nr:apolipoprotein N-acyltransferase [Candidatus Eremiobacteraeota bacterium]
MKTSLRIISTSIRLRDFGIAALGAVALALAFPKTGLAWLTPLGAAALFWSWQGLSWKRAFGMGWFAGFLFFSISFWWMSFTIVNDVGSLAYVAVFVIAAFEALAFALAAAGTVLSVRYAHPVLAPLGSAAAFTVAEWLRSIGPFGVPFAQLGYSQADSPLAVFAAYIGTFGVTFVLCIFAAYLAQAVATQRNRSLLLTVVALAAVWSVAFAAWPARHAATPAIRVAIVQGNIAQSIKWSAGAFRLGVERYTADTARTSDFAPALVLWPETVITTELNRDPALLSRFGALARSLHATLAVGSQERSRGGIYNAMYVFGPNGTVRDVYQKRQLVPFAESFPGKGLLKYLPGTADISDFSSGSVAGVYDAGPIRFAPLICWESAFADLAHDQLRNGAQLLVVATDDAWFGNTSGPYQHAQIAQLRAIESGTWLIRAGATGISGIIAPNGQWVERSQLDRQELVEGYVGAPTGSPFARIGPTAVVLAIALLYVSIVLWTPLRRRGPRA